MIGKRDDRTQAINLKNEFRSYMESFEHHMQNKPSFMFASDSVKLTNSNSISPGPGAYKLDENEFGKKKDFSRPVKIFVAPIRNLDGAITNSSVSPALQTRGLINEYYTPGPVAELQLEKIKPQKYKKFGIKMLSQT